MTVSMDTTTGEIYTIDELIHIIEHSEEQINNYKIMANFAKTKLMQLAEFNNGVKTARIQGKNYRCKVELPSKITWDQKKLSRMYSIYPHGTIIDGVIKIASYKVDMREYKKIINTTGDEEFNNFKNELLSANLGITGAPKFTIVK
jgi:hypothetical protein